MIAKWMAIVSMLIAGCAGATGLPFELDDSFGERGRVWTDLGTSPQAQWLTPLADGSIVITSHGSVARFLPDGQRDPAFGFAGHCLAQFVCLSGLGQAVRTQDGKFLIPAVAGQGGFDYEEPLRYVVIRLLSDGRFDSTWGSGGIASVNNPSFAIQDVHAAGLVVATDGTVVVAGASQFQPSGERFLSAARLQPDGSADESFGPNGRRITDIVALPRPLFARAPDGGFALVAGDVVVARFLVTGESDRRFDIYRDATALAIRTRAVTYDAEGGILIAGHAPVVPYPFQPVSPAVYRIAPNGLRDERFGTGGRVVMPWDQSSASAHSIAVDSAGRIVLFGSVRESSRALSVSVLRLLAEGRPDPFFAPAGRVLLDAGLSQPLGGAVAPDGRLLVAAAIVNAPPVCSGPYPIVGIVCEYAYRAALYRLNGGAASLPFDSEQELVVEYFHAGFGHYFVTPLLHEKASLQFDPAWARTGRSFRAWSKPGAGTLGVCRFFSDQSFSPKSSHFYTPYEHECAGLKGGSLWRYEGQTFQVRMPEGTPGARTCPAGTQPLHRAYNNSMGGAPNHRYMTDPVLLDQMIAQRWVMEGDAQTRVFACVPLQ